MTDKATARRALQHDEARLRLAQTAAQIGTWEWDPVRGVSSLSADLHRIFGTHPNDPEQQQIWASRVHPADWKDVQQWMEEGYRSGNMEFEYRYHHPETGLRYFFCKGHRVEHESRMSGVLLDVTDRNLAEKALRQSEERFRAIVETTPECVKVVAPDGTLLHMNSACLTVFGVDCSDEVVGKSFYDLIAPEDRDKFRQFNERICRGEKGALEFDIIGVRGVRRHMESQSVPFALDDGTTAHLAVARDITARKSAEDARYRLAAIVASSDDAIVSKSLNGIVTSWNAAAEKMFGYTAQDMIGQPITVIIPPELHQDEQLILETIARGDRVQHFETVRVAKNGERIEVSLTISPVRDEAGRIVGAAKIARNITERKKTEQALRTSEGLAAVGKLAATVAHEINNPLEAVQNLIYLAMHCAVKDEVRGYLSAAEEELDRVSNLTKQTLSFYRGATEPTPTRLGPLAKSLLSVFSSRIRNKEIDVRPEIRQDPEIMAVSNEMRQLVANLISNSIDAVPPRGRLRIRISAATERSGCRRPGVRLTVADSGPGIPRALHSKLFEPFFTTKKDVGTGLGLWVSKNIVEKHGGFIQLKSSVTPGRSWTAFSVFLPADSQPSMMEDGLKPAV